MKKILYLLPLFLSILACETQPLPTQDVSNIVNATLTAIAKNNLQVISGLLELQGSRSQDENIKNTITDIQNRVLSISFIHQNL